MEGSFVDVEGIPTHCIDVGEGPVVLLIHGAALSIDAEFTWFRQLESLAKTHRVIAFDQPGFGRTGKPSDGYMGRELRSAHAMAFMKRLGLASAVLVGHSEGGYIALRTAVVAPELVSALVVVTSGSASPLLGGSDDDAAHVASKKLYSVGDVDESSFIAGLRDYSLHWDDRMETLARRNIRRDIESGHVAMMRNLPASETDMARYMSVQQEYLQPYLSRIEVPALLLWSGNDETVPIERGVKLLRAMPNADLVVMPHARHNLMHDRPDAFDAILREWIARQHSPQANNRERIGT